MIIMPSLLAAPSLQLYQSIEDLLQEGFRTFHIDMMDYHYTHNFGLTPKICEDILKAFPKASLDVHLMTNPTPPELIQRLQDIGIQDIAVHPGTLPNIPSNLRIALSPEEATTPIDHKDLLFLLVSPGFSHQAMNPKILTYAKKAKDKGSNITLDGGINLQTLDTVLQINPDRIVIGGGLFSKDREALMVRLRDLLN